MYAALSLDVQLHSRLLLRHRPRARLDHEDGEGWVPRSGELLARVHATAETISKRSAISTTYLKPRAIELYSASPPIMAPATFIPKAVSAFALLLNDPAKIIPAKKIGVKTSRHDPST